MVRPALILASCRILGWCGVVAEILAFLGLEVVQVLSWWFWFFACLLPSETVARLWKLSSS